MELFSPANLVALAMWGALVIYTSTVGADLGGVVWELLATGPDMVIPPVLVTLALGYTVLIPSCCWLYKVFKPPLQAPGVST